MGSLYHIEIQIKKLETIHLKMYNSYSYQAEAPADEYEDEEEYEVKKQGQLSCWGNAQSMNLNPLILTNIIGSPYFKVQLFNIKTYHEVIDEIYYKVDHLEPWERGSRSTSGQTGMCGGVRGVGAGGIVSSAYCLLYKLYTLKLTKKQVNGLLVHCDSPFIRGLGFMYIRYTQPPTDLLNWFEEYLDDEEEIDPKAGGGKPMTIGEMVKSMLVRLEWFDTRFPRIPVNVQKQINASLDQRRNPGNGSRYDAPDKYSQNFNDRNRDRKIGERKTGTEKIVKKDINIDVVDQDHGTITETIEDTKIILMTTLLMNLRGIPNIERNRIKSEGHEVVVENGDN